MAVSIGFFGCNTSQKELLETNNINSLNKYMDLCWNSREGIEFNSIATTDFYRVVNGINVVSNSNEMEAHINVYKTAFPDLKVAINKTITSHDTICVLWEITGSNTGIYGETKATGKKIKISGSSILYFTSNSKLKGEITHYNELDLLQQLGYTLIAPIVE